MKRRVVGTFLLLFALWPGVHRGLVAAFDMNPWKLAGFAMYAQPSFPPQVELLALRGGEQERIERVTPFERALLEDYADRRRSIGRLASPRSLAESLLERRADLDGVAVRVTTRYLDPETAFIEQRVERLEFRR